MGATRRRAGEGLLYRHSRMSVKITVDEYYTSNSSSVKTRRDRTFFFLQN